MNRISWIIPAAFALAASSLVAPPAQAAVVTINVVNYEFQGGARTVALGTDVRWKFVDAPHTSTSDQGFWDARNYPQGAIYQRSFLEAGRFAYHCARHPSMMRSSIAVRLYASSIADGAKISWAVVALPGHNYDVQVKRPGTKKWRAFRSGTTTTYVDFTPTLKGRWLFRARTRNLDNDKVSGWSPRKRVPIL